MSVDGHLCPSFPVEFSFFFPSKNAQYSGGEGGP